MYECCTGSPIDETQTPASSYYVIVLLSHNFFFSNVRQLVLIRQRQYNYPCDNCVSEIFLLSNIALLFRNSASLSPLLQCSTCFAIVLTIYRGVLCKLLTVAA